jgi:CRP-like cAMP-binding protein
MDREEMKALKKILGRTDFIYLVPESAIERFLGKFYSLSFKDGEMIFKEGKSAGAFLIVAEGKLDIFVTNDKGEEIKIKTLEAVDYVGEAALLSGDVRNATVRAHNEVKAYILGKASFDALLGEVPGVREFLLKVVEKRRKDASRRTEGPKSRKGRLPGRDAPVDEEKEQALIGKGNEIIMHQSSGSQ